MCECACLCVWQLPSFPSLRYLSITTSPSLHYLSITPLPLHHSTTSPSLPLHRSTTSPSLLSPLPLKNGAWSGPQGTCTIPDVRHSQPHPLTHVCYMLLQLHTQWNPCGTAYVLTNLQARTILYQDAMA